MTNDSRQKLTIEQQNAIDLLITGASDREASEAAHVSRPTVTSWRLYNPFFRAELNRRRADLFRGAQDRLRCLVPKALERLERELEDGSGTWRAAVEVLKLAPGPIGPTDPMEIVDQRAWELRGGDPTQAMLDQLNGHKPSLEERARALDDLLTKEET